MRRIVNIILIIAFAVHSAAQTTDQFPVKEWRMDNATTYIFYICGDGGLNNFSIGLCNNLNKAGYDITALNAKSYFWEKKTPEESSDNIGGYLEKLLHGKSNCRIVMVGYSFGADVMPFIISKLPGTLKNKLAGVLLISPSQYTDFEIHWLDYLGVNKKRSMDVVDGINRMNVPRTMLFFGEDESGFPADKAVKVDTLIKIPGGHHFDHDSRRLADILIREIKRL
jgi:type IV secretory pathway VirJ component